MSFLTKSLGTRTCLVSVRAGSLKTSKSVHQQGRATLARSSSEIASKNRHISGVHRELGVGGRSLIPISPSRILQRSYATQAASASSTSTEGNIPFAKLLKTSSLIHNSSFIDNEFLSFSPSSLQDQDAGKSKSFDVNNPATGELLGKVREGGSVQEVERAIESAQKAFEGWRKSSPKTRQDLLQNFFRLMQIHAEDLALIITSENGKPISDSRGEVAYSASFLEWFSAEAVREYGDVVPSTIPGLRNVVIKQAVGPVGVITPWNFPSAMITRKIAPAIAAGCTCVVKLPSETPFSGLALAHLAREAGFPPGVLNVIVSSDSATVGEVLCADKRIKKISFTGSTGVGKILAKQSSSTLKKLSLELGGNAPFIVFDDADVDEAVKGAIACKFRSSGQTCVCANRIYVHESVFDEFSEKLVAAVATFKVGNGLEDGITHGPLIHSRAVTKVDEHVQDAVNLGARLLHGGNRISQPGLSDNFFEPTVLADVPANAACMSEETFGPMAALVKFSSEEQVLKWANDSDVGLAGYFYSRDIGRVWRVAEALEVGMVGTNTGLISQAAIPFGGVKESGYGREGSRYGMADYQIIKVVCMGGLGDL